MKSRAAVLHGTQQEWQIEEIEVDAPKAGEVIVEWKAAGLCHSDEHLVTGDMVPPEEAWAAMGSAYKAAATAIWGGFQNFSESLSCVDPFVCFRTSVPATGSMAASEVVCWAATVPNRFSPPLDWI